MLFCAEAQWAAAFRGRTMLSEKRAVLFSSAKSYAATPSDETAKALCMAARAYGEALLASASGGAAARRQQAQQEADGVVMPFGRNKGKRLQEVSRSDLEWTLGWVEKSLADASKARFIEENQKLKDALTAELGRRA